MNKKSFKIAALFMSMLALISFSSCSSDDDPTAGTAILPEKRITLPHCDYGVDNWIYFSFSEGKVLSGINESNRAENLTWDIAFYRYNVRTNGGKSGKGQGGAFDTQKTKMTAVPEAPTSGYNLDIMGEVTANVSSFPPPTIKTPLNAELGCALEFQGPPPTYTPNNHVYVVKTADGKYAKIKIEGFHNDEGESGYITFSYVYQPDGSTDLR